MRTRDSLRKDIELAWDNKSDPSDFRDAVQELICALDEGVVRVVELMSSGDWVVNEWVKKGILLYFILSENQTIDFGFEYRDKVPVKRGYESLGVRVVPPAVCRYGAFLSPGVVMMPSYVNIGAFVGNHTMLDTWSTVGSCAHIGARVHLSGGVGIGGVLEPVQSRPVIIEDDVFVGSRSILVEGVRVCREAVIGAGVVITASTAIMDVSGSKPVEYKGYIPERSVVIPGSYPKKFPAGVYYVPCALIIGQRKKSTDKKVSLNEALRDHRLSV